MFLTQRHKKQVLSLLVNRGHIAIPSPVKDFYLLYTILGPLSASFLSTYSPDIWVMGYG